MLQIIKKALQQIIDDIDAGNTSMSEAELIEAVQFLQRLNSRTQFLNRTQAAEYLHLSQRTFDRYVHDGIIPHGRHARGDKQIFWLASDLDHVKL